MRVCVICQETTKGSHFGVDSCRACSEFFRRSVVDKRTYSCRHGGNCTIHKSIRRLCRKCRLEKCIELGMQISGVYITQKELDRLDADSPENNIEHTPSSSQLHLETVWNNYQELCSIRAETEKRLDPEGYKTANQSGMLKGMYHATPKIFNLFTRAHTPTVVEFVAKSIVGYEELSKEEREILLRPFLIYFWWMEGCHRVYKKAPKDLYTSLILVTDTSYMDVSREDKLFDNSQPNAIPPYVVNDLMSLLKQELRADRQRSTFLMHEMQIRDFEMIALAELLFWNSTVEGCSDILHQKIHKGRGRIMMSLEKYYDSIKEPEPFVRMGSIVNIQNATFIEIFRCREDMESYKIHDAFESFDFMYKVIKDVG